MRVPLALSVFLSICAVGLLAACTDAEETPVDSGPTTPDGRGGEAPEAPEAPEGPIRFEDRTQAAGIDFEMAFLADEQGEKFKINLYDHGCGVAVADYDGDGHDDVFFLNQLGANALYRNEGDGTFENTTERAGGLGLADRVCVAAVFGDYDEDGDQDLYVTSTRGGNVLFRNEGDGTFTDATEAAGLTHVGHSQGATLFDYDDDGFLDLFLTNTAVWTTDAYDEAQRYFAGKPQLFDLVQSEHEASIMYRNRGDGTFEDVTDALGLDRRGWGGDVAVFDLDDDGDLDLFVTNMFGASLLYRNDDGEAFVDVRREVLGRTSWGSIGVRVLDANSDGRLDLALADMHSDMWMSYDLPIGLIEPAVKYGGVWGRMPELDKTYVESEREIAEQLGIEYDAVKFGNTLFVSRGDGRLAEVSDAVGFETFWPWGIATGDFDADGHEDIYLPSGMGYPYFYWPSPLLRNRGNGTFEDVAESAGLEPPAGGRDQAQPIGGRAAPRSSRCAATADFDGDGRLDLVVNNFNAPPYYLVNVSPAQHYLSLRLRGTVSNADAIGALVRLRAGGRRFVRQVQAAGGYLSQSSKTLHFGLGAIDRVERCEIRWPSGRETILEDVAADQLLDVVEDDR